MTNFCTRLWVTLYRNPEPSVSNIVRINPLPDKQKPKFIRWKKAERVQRSPDPPIFNHNDSIVLFNFLGNSIEFYSPTGEYVKKTSIDFHLETYYDLFIFKNRGIEVCTGLFRNMGKCQKRYKMTKQILRSKSD